MADSKRKQPSRPSAAPAASPPPAETGNLVFVHHGPPSSSRTRTTLTTAARSHASRRGHSKSAAAAATVKPPIRFVLVQGAGPNVIATPDAPGENGGAAAAGSSAPLAIPTPPEEPTTVSARHLHRHYDSYHQWQLHQHQHSFVATDFSSRAVVPTPGEARPPRSLRADSWDPFDSLAVRSLSHAEQFMLHYALTTTWSKFGESKTGQQELAQSWIWTTIESPAALYAQIAGASAHYLTVPYANGAQQRQAFTTGLQAKQKALKALRRELDQFHRQQQELADRDRRRRHDDIPGYHASPEAAAAVAFTFAGSSSPSPPASESASGSASSSPPYMSNSAPVEPVLAQAAGATDSMVLAILVLAVHDSIDLTPVPEPHPLAPLATYRDLHIYGQMAMREEHMTALISLVEQKGGLPRMNQAIFGYVVPPADMLYNLRRGTAPRVPCHRRLVPMRDSNDWHPDARANCLLGLSGSAFREVECLYVVHRATSSTALDVAVPAAHSTTMTTTTSSSPPAVSVGLEEEVLHLLDLMAELTVAFDHYIRGDNDTGFSPESGVAQAVSGQAPRSLDFFVNNADLVAHRLTSLGSLLTGHQDTIQGTATTSTIMTDPDLGRSADEGPPPPPPPPHNGDQSSYSTTSRAEGGDIREVRRCQYPRYLVLHDISRRAAMVYQDMVIFPTPARTGVKLRHARAMLPLLRALLGSGGQQREQHDYGMGECSSEDHQLEVEVVYDGSGDGEQATDSIWDTGSREKVLHGRDGAYTLWRSPLPSSTSSAQGNTTTPISHRDNQRKDFGPRLLSEADFLSWATMLGAIATRFTPLQDAYVAQLARDVGRRSTDCLAMGMNHYPSHDDESATVAAWQEQKSRMVRFLWLDAVCDEPGRIVWEQALTRAWDVER